MSVRVQNTTKVADKDVNNCFLYPRDVISMLRHTTASLNLENRGAFRRAPSIRSPPLTPRRLGIRCEVADVCADAPCRHGGKCTYYSNNKSFACECRNTGYRGSLCEIDIDECTRNGLRGFGYG